MVSQTLFVDILEAEICLRNSLGEDDKVLIRHLQTIGELLAQVEQMPPQPLKDTILPLMNLFLSETVSKKPDMDVRALAVAAIIELLRITAPDAPFRDDQLMAAFEMTIDVLDLLSRPSGLAFDKVVSVLGVMSKIKIALILLDLYLDPLIVKMFEQFFKNIRSDLPESVFPFVVSIMTLVIENSESIPEELLSVLLSSVRKENREASPMTLELGEKVFAESAKELRPYIVEEVRNGGISLNDYADIVNTIYVMESNQPDHNLDDPNEIPESNEPAQDPNEDKEITNGADPSSVPKTSKLVVSDKKVKLGSEPTTIPQKPRGGPTFFMNLAEGYESWTGFGPRKPASRKPVGKSNAALLLSGKLTEVVVSETIQPRRCHKKSKTSKDAEAVGVEEKTPEKPNCEPSQDVSLDSSGLRRSTRKRTDSVKKSLNTAMKAKSSNLGKITTEPIHKKKLVIENEEDPEIVNLGEGLVGKKVIVWWPLDKEYYDGVITSYDADIKKHLVTYTDGDEEVLNLKRQQWHLI